MGLEWRMAFLGRERGRIREQKSKKHKTFSYAWKGMHNILSTLRIKDPNLRTVKLVTLHKLYNIDLSCYFFLKAIG